MARPTRSNPSPVALTDDDDDDLYDFDRVRAARWEAKGTQRRLKFGSLIVTLPPEFPVDVLSPILDLDLDMALLWRIAQQAQQTGDTRELETIAIDFMVGNPNLPKDLIRAVCDVARRFLGDAGYQALSERHPSREDLGALAKKVIAWYGVNLGEALASSGSSEPSGGPSTPTSNASTDSTSETSTALEAPASSESAA